MPPDIPSAPGRVVPTRNTDTSVVVSWEGSREAKELVGYYIEDSIVGSNIWEPCNNKPVKGTRYNGHILYNSTNHTQSPVVLNITAVIWPQTL